MTAATASSSSSALSLLSLGGVLATLARAATATRRDRCRIVPAWTTCTWRRRRRRRRRHAVGWKIDGVAQEFIFSFSATVLATLATLTTLTTLATLARAAATTYVGHVSHWCLFFWVLFWHRFRRCFCWHIHCFWHRRCFWHRCGSVHFSSRLTCSARVTCSLPLPTLKCISPRCCIKPPVTAHHTSATTRSASSSYRTVHLCSATHYTMTRDYILLRADFQSLE